MSTFWTRQVLDTWDLSQKFREHVVEAWSRATSVGRKLAEKLKHLESSSSHHSLAGTIQCFPPPAPRASRGQSPVPHQPRYPPFSSHPSVFLPHLVVNSHRRQTAHHKLGVHHYRYRPKSVSALYLLSRRIAAMLLWRLHLRSRSRGHWASLACRSRRL